jgi:hypothetical protein
MNANRMGPVLLIVPLLVATIACDEPRPTEVRRYKTVLTQHVSVDYNMVDWLNQFQPRAGGWAYGDPLPEEEITVPATAAANVVFTVEGEEFTVDVDVTGLTPADTVTDPIASVAKGERVTGDIWDIWMGSFAPSTLLVQLGTLIPDADDPTHATLFLDSRTARDINGDKLTVSSLTSVETHYPNQSISLFDVQQFGIDVEATQEDSPDEQSGQLRLTDAAPLGVPIDWTKPEIEF